MDAWVELIPFLAVLGIIVGLLAGMLGIGGGVVLVPGLYFALSSLGYSPDVNMHVAVGTSLAIIVPTGLSSAGAHWKRGAVRKELVVRIGIGIVVGAVAGSVTADFMSGETLKAVFALALMALAGIMLTNPARFSIMTEEPRLPWSALAGSGIGFLSTLMGIGGATISVPYMSVCRVPIREAVGTAAALGLVISVPAAAGFVLTGLDEAGLPPYSLGYVNGLAWLAVAPLSVLFAPLGAKIAHALPVGRLRKIFALFVLLVALRMLAGVLLDV